MRTLLSSVEEKRKYVSVRGAVQILGVPRGSLWYYIHSLNLETFKFPFDIKAYLLRSDVERVKVLLDAAKNEVEQGVPA